MRRVLVALLAVIVVVAMAIALWQYSGDDPTPALRLTEVSGEVRLERPAAGTSPAARGTVLAPNDRIATGEVGRAVLTLGRDTHIRVAPESSVQVVGVDPTGVSLELENGALHATVRPESGAVRVANRGREVVSTSGEFEVGVQADVLQVAAVRGALVLSGTDHARIEEGQQVTVVDRHAELGPIPEELLIDVQWPEAARTRAATTVVSGRTTPGARVRLSGAFGATTVVADRTGAFVAEVPLAEGGNPVAIEAVDPLGHRATVRGVLQTRDTQGPSFSGGVQYDGQSARREGAGQALPE